jgi:dipeptidyl aminopeptidase/acylaminoacyl peptidase
MDGSERRQLTFSPMSAFNPRWSPDGKSIAFQAETPDKPPKIYIVPANGGSARQVTTGPRNDVDPTWSPDGQSLIFASGTFGGMPDNSIAIHRIDLRTNEVSSLPGSQGLMSPQWSPSGRYVNALTTDWQKLMLFDFTTQAWVELCAERRLGWHYWSRREDYIYFDNNLLFGNAPSIERLRISDRKIERVVALEEVGRLGIGNLGPWTGLALDDSPLVLRDVGTQEIYALDAEFP